MGFGCAGGGCGCAGGGAGAGILACVAIWWAAFVGILAPPFAIGLGAMVPSGRQHRARRRPPTSERSNYCLLLSTLCLYRDACGDVLLHRHAQVRVRVGTHRSSAFTGESHSLIAISFEKYMTIGFRGLRFIDSFLFLASSLEKLTENLVIKTKSGMYDGMGRCMIG